MDPIVSKVLWEVLPATKDYGTWLFIEKFKPIEKSLCDRETSVQKSLSGDRWLSPDIPSLWKEHLSL